MNDLEFDLMIKKIMIHRKPEHFLDDIFMNLTGYTHNYYIDFLFFKKGDDLLFEYNSKNECLYYHFYKINLILKEKYHCDSDKINELIKGGVEEYLKLSVKTTLAGIFHVSARGRTSQIEYKKHNKKWMI